MKIMKKGFLILTLGALVLSSCNEINTLTLEDHQGAFILNKGNSETSTISRFNYETEEVTNNIFQEKNNGQQLGTGATAFVIKPNEDYVKGKGYIVFPEAGSIDMINMETYKIEGSIDGLSYPTDIVLANETTAYVSCGNGVADSDKDNIVAKVDLETYSVTNSLPVGEGPSKLITSGKFLYVANSGGNFKNGNTITVYDMSKDSLIDQVEVGIQPIDMEVDVDRNIWVYCNGDQMGNDRSLYKIERKFVTDDIVTDSLVHVPHLMIDLGDEQAKGPNTLAMSRTGRYIYYLNGKTYVRSVYKEDNSADKEAIAGDYSDVTLNGIDFDYTTGNLYGLIENGDSNGSLLLFTYDDDQQYIFNSEYGVGIQPIFTTFSL